jgi:hypothetical protein
LREGFRQPGKQDPAFLNLENETGSPASEIFKSSCSISGRDFSGTMGGFAKDSYNRACKLDRVRDSAQSMESEEHGDEMFFLPESISDSRPPFGDKVYSVHCWKK